MKTDMGCVRIIFNNECPECGEMLDGTDEKSFHYPLTNLLENGGLVCSCGTDFEWTSDVEILA